MLLLNNGKFWENGERKPTALTSLYLKAKLLQVKTSFLRSSVKTTVSTGIYFL